MSTYTVLASTEMPLLVVSLVIKLCMASAALGCNMGMLYGYAIYSTKPDHIGESDSQD